MADKKKIEELAFKIAELISAYNVAYDTAIYFNGKRLQCFTTNDEEGWIEEEGYKGSDYCDYANNETITMTFEGDFYYVINGYAGDFKLVDDFNELLDSYEYYYELGNAWNLALYK